MRNSHLLGRQFIQRLDQIGNIAQQTDRVAREIANSFRAKMSSSRYSIK